MSSQNLTCCKANLAEIRSGALHFLTNTALDPHPPIVYPPNHLLNSPVACNRKGLQMKTRVLLVRHGGTVLSAEDRFARSLDVMLSDEGRAQALELGRRPGKVRLET